MILLIDAEKEFDKIEHTFMIKSISKVVKKKTYLNVIKTIYDKLTGSIIVN